jgi:hypothetical protein
MPRKKVVKEPIEKLKDEVVLEIIEDSSDEEAVAPPPPAPETAIKVTKGNEVITDMSVDDIKKELPKPARKKRVLTEEQKAKMKAGRERRKAEKALQAGKEQKKVANIITSNQDPPVEAPPPPPKEEQMPSWFKAYLATQKQQPEPVKTAPAKKPRGRPVGKKDSKPRAKKNVVAPQEVVLPPPKQTMRFI